MENKEVIISVKNLTKDYKRGRGIFDISFDVYKGEIFGYCGTNGSGKTTTLRHIMGFLKPDKGSVTVKGMDAYKKAEYIKEFVGYLPGEIAFPDVQNGTEFLKIQAKMINLKDMSRAEHIINALQLDPTANLRRMSKGMKQKTALVAAFMHQPEIIILDEPTTGLDPLMREEFIKLIKEEKEKGTTIIMSNHMFDELEETCDRIAFIKDGHLIDICDMNKLNNLPYRDYNITFRKKSDFLLLSCVGFEIVESIPKENTITVRLTKATANDFIRLMNGRELIAIKEKRHTLEEYFLERIGGEKNGKGN